MSSNSSSGQSTSASKHVIWLSAVQPNHFDEIGFKALNLSVAKRVNLPVPPSFCITTSAYRCCLEEMGLDLDKLPQLDQATLLEYAQTIQQKLYQAPLPATVHAEIRNAYRDMMRQNEFPLALRPSLPYASSVDFSRILRPMLNIKGIIEFERALKICWVYMWSAEVLKYRFQDERLSQRFDDLAILVQPYFDIQASGGLLSFDSRNGKTDRFMIESSWGVNESVNRGWYNPDHFVWNRSTKKIEEHQLAKKTTMLKVGEQSALEEMAVPADKQATPSLGRQDLLELAQVTEKLVAAYKRTVELEWIKTPQKLYILQFTPTEAYCPEQTPVLGEPVPGVANQYFKQAYSTLGWSVLHPLLERATQNVLTHFSIDQEHMPESFYILSQGVPRSQAFFGLALNEVLKLWTETWQDTSFKNWVRLAKDIFQSQWYWQSRLKSYSNDIQVLWEQELVPADSDALLDKLTFLEGVIQSFLEAAIYCRIMAAGLKHLFSEFYMPLICGLEGQSGSEHLWTGLESRQTEAYTVLAQLLHQIKEDSELATLFRQKRGRDLRLALESTEKGQAFYHSVLEKTGEHGFIRAVLDPYFPTWIEEPESVLDVLHVGLAKNLSFWQEDKQAQRIQSTLELSEGIGKSKLHKQLGFQFFLGVTQKYLAMQEDEPHYISMYQPILRRILLALSKHLPLETERDIFFLELPEIKQLLKSTLDSESIQNWHSKIRLRKYEYKSYTQKGQLKPERVFKGLSAYGGQALGRVQLVFSSEDLKQIRPGDILVTDYFEPHWRSICPHLAGIITECGGVLSHAGTMARGFKIPSIMGIKQISKFLKSGQVIRIDASLGEVQILPSDIFK